jgi:hypothetical protein
MTGLRAQDTSPQANPVPPPLEFVEESSAAPAELDKRFKSLSALASTLALQKPGIPFTVSIR